jgi:hemerythrin-like metal-binding protein
VRSTRSDGSGFVQLVWRDAYASGHARIDEQHQALFSLANELLHASLTGESSATIMALAAELQRKTVSHFAYEESLLLGLDYPDLDAHIVEHQELIRRAEQLWNDANEQQASVAELFQFLAYDVIAHHLLGADRLYFPYMENRIAANQ